MFGKKSKGKVFVGLSGGVDSAVSAALLQQSGYEVTGVFIKIQIPGYPCPAADDRISAQRVAARLRIPFIEIDLSKEYETEVFQNSIAEFKKGRTPNPDTLCNQKIKFGAFYKFAKSRGADYIATGHYARIQQGEALLARPRLAVGMDKDKDQSYFLWMLPETVLRYALFPVGSLKKSEVRELAKKFGLPNAERRDSQGLCFLGDISLQEMLERELMPVPGEVLDEAGVVVGVHHGAALYTLGERRGFELFAKTPHTEAHFVVAKDIARNTITVSALRAPRSKTQTEIMLAQCNWIGTVADGEYAARYRYRGALIPARLKLAHSRIVLAEACFVPEGQSLVVYEGERCLGGGIVDSAELH